MSKLRVNAFTISLDGFGAGPDQSLDAPLGVGAQTLHQWFVPTRRDALSTAHDDSAGPTRPPAPDGQKTGRMYCRWGCSVAPSVASDAAFYGSSAPTAPSTSPQHRLCT